MKFQLRLLVAQGHPVEIVAGNTEELRMALVGACEQAAPGWLRSVAECAPFFHFEGSDDVGEWSGLPYTLREYPGSLAHVVVGITVPGLDGRFVTLNLEIGYLCRMSN